MEARAGRDYRKREAIIHMMGYRSYREYLDSPQWGAIRADVLRDRPNCYACGKRANEIHHRDYRHSTLCGQCKVKLVPVCRGCHYEAEMCMGRKVPLSVANRRLELIRQRNIRRRLQTAAKRVP